MGGGGGNTNRRKDGGNNRHGDLYTKKSLENTISAGKGRGASQNEDIG